MKKVMAVFLALILTGVFACAFADETAASTPSVALENNVISAEALLALIDENKTPYLFDVREYDAFAQGALPSAMCIPLAELRATMEHAIQNGMSVAQETMYVYGATKEDGHAAAALLREMGVGAVYYLPSVDEWTGDLVRETQWLGSMRTRDIDGNQVDASLIRGKKLVMVNVWGTYCNPCISEMAGLGNLSREMEADGVMVLGLVIDCSAPDLSADEAQTALARTIVEQTRATYPHLLPSMEIYRNVVLGINAVPTTFFLNGDGDQVGQVYLGARDQATWKQIIADTLAETARKEE